ncbi:MAG: 8-amino-7-oxononanoate synthase [Nitrospirae bacterium]|nr:8-amino-7-oxononanoate synthase [Nitrospirota bacterium]
MFEAALTSLKARHLYRTLRTIASGQNATITLHGRACRNFGSNNYLGLADHPEVKAAAVEAVMTYGVGAGASRLITGTMPPHEQCEAALAAFTGAEAALLLGGGYAANVGLIPALMESTGGPDGVLFADRYNHASLVDGCRLSRAGFKIYRHKDLEQLDRLLARTPPRAPKLIVTDGVFSMDGDLAPLPGLLALARRYDALLFVDDAHGTGVMGHTGRGTCEHFGLPHDDRLIHMGTLSKALGGFGAFVAGPASLIAYVQNRCRSFLYTTAPPPALAAAATAALAIIDREPERRAALWRHRARCAEALSRMGYDLMGSETPILPVRIGDPATALAVADGLLARRCFAPAIRPPTVPTGTDRLRLSLMATHTTDDIDALIDALREAGRRHHLIPS